MLYYGQEEGGLNMKDIKSKSKQAFNNQANTYDQDIKGQHARNLYPVLIEELSKISYDTILDLGCGTGAVLQAILNEDCKKKAYGIDISENMLKVARGKLKESATLVLGDSEYLPFENDFFDVVYCNDSFHHYPRPDRVLSELSRVLKPKGNLIICDCWQPFLFRDIMNVFMKYSKNGNVKMYSEKEICGLLSVDFNDIVWKNVNNTSYIVTAKNKKH